MEQKIKALNKDILSESKESNNAIKDGYIKK